MNASDSSVNEKHDDLICTHDSEHTELSAVFGGTQINLIDCLNRMTSMRPNPWYSFLYNLAYKRAHHRSLPTLQTYRDTHVMNDLVMKGFLKLGETMIIAVTVVGADFRERRLTQCGRCFLVLQCLRTLESISLIAWT